MHHNNMRSGSGLWHFLYRLVHKFILPVVSSKKEVETASRNRNRKTHYYDAFREWWIVLLNFSRPQPYCAWTHFTLAAETHLQTPVTLCCPLFGPLSADVWLPPRALKPSTYGGLWLTHTMHNTQMRGEGTMQVSKRADKNKQIANIDYTRILHFISTPGQHSAWSDAIARLLISNRNAAPTTVQAVSVLVVTSNGSVGRYSLLPILLNTRQYPVLQYQYH